MTNGRYRTIAEPATAEIVVKRSRFRCLLARVDTEDDARGLIADQRRVNWDARHHCFAMVLGPDGATQRSSDDGEPSGTAGAPMLQVLLGHGLSDTVAVVTRWFGGVLLGAGGLARAYGDAVTAALREASVIRRMLFDEVVVELPHADAGRVENAIRAAAVRVLGTDYAQVARLRLATPPETLTEVTQLVSELTGGTARPEIVGQRWVDQPVQ
ncbi:MAG: YigZ family protein [Micrococcales bacterium]|nr:MAG: YigZ family protein [Micrococcales bacterium]PIE27500.1 MAG: YigZ family protein [Micrococcales bacterium]